MSAGARTRKRLATTPCRRLGLAGPISPQNVPGALSPDISSILSHTPRPSHVKLANGKSTSFNMVSLSNPLNSKVSARSLGVRCSSASAPDSFSASNSVRKGVVRRRVCEGQWELGTPKVTLECNLSREETRLKRWMLWAVGMKTRRRR